MPATSYDIDIEKGADWGLTINYKDENSVAINLTGCSVKSEIKTIADLSSEVALEITAVITDAANGIIDLSLTDTQTATLIAVGPNHRYLTKYAYDVLLTLLNGTTIRLLNGTVNVSPGVTAL